MQHTTEVEQNPEVENIPHTNVRVDKVCDADDKNLLRGNDIENGDGKGRPQIETDDPDWHRESRRWKGKNKATDSAEYQIYYYGKSPSDFKGFINYCESECPHDVDSEKIDFAIEHLKGIPRREWYRYRKDHFRDVCTWQEFVKVLEDALQAFTNESSNSFINESLTSFHNNGTLSNSASVTKETDPYDVVDFLAVMQHRRIDILPIKWEPELNVGVGGTAKIFQGGNVETSEGLQLSFVFKRVHHETSREVDQHKEYRALLSEVYILGHPVVRHHPNIISLEGVFWDTVYDKTWPVLVFKRSTYGDLKQFMNSDEGRKLDFNARIKLCREIGNAILLMHSCHAVHGDLKPDNVLIFKDVEDQYSAKVADFGYSTLFAEDSDSAEVVLPESWPWTAPEIEDCPRVTFEQAKSADIFSYGLICLWLLCYETLPRKQSQGERGPSLHVIWEMKRREDLASSAFAEVRANIGGECSMEKSFALKWFLDVTLSINRGTRKLHTDCLSVPFGCSGEPLPLIDEYGKSVSIISKSSFDLVGMFSQFRASGRPTWYAVFKCLEDRAKGHIDCSARKLAAYQLAFCYEIGFGVAIDKQKSQSWMELSGRTQQDLDDAIEMIREDVSSIYKNIMSNAGYFDQEKPRKALPEHAQEGNDSDTHPPDATGNPSTANIFLLASTAAWIHKSLGIEPGDVRLTIVPEEETEEEGEEKLQQLCRDQFGWEDGGRTTTKISLTFDHDDIFNTFPVERSTESVEVEANLSTPEDKEKRLVRSMERKLKVLGPEHEDTLRDMDALCQLYVEHGKLTEAEPLEIHVLNTRRDKLGQQHPSTLRTMEKVAGLCMLRQSWKEAETIMLVIWDTRKKVSGSKHPSTVKTLEHLDYLVRRYVSNGMHEDGVALTELILEARKKAFGDDNEMTLWTMQTLALFYGTKEDKHREAEKLLTEVVRLREKLLGSDHPRTLETLQILAGLHGMRIGEQEMLNKAHELQVRIQNAKARPPKMKGAMSSGGTSMYESQEHACEHARDLSSSVNSMGQLMWGYFEQNIDSERLDDEVRKAEEALKVLEDESPDRSKVLARQAEALVRRFRQLNDSDDLDYALIWAEQAMVILPEDHPDKALRLEELSAIHWIRFELGSSPNDLEKSIEYIEESVTTNGGQELIGRMETLAKRLKKKYEETGDSEVLEMAIVWAEQVTEVMTEDDTRRVWLVQLGSWLKEKYGLSHSVDDLNGAIDAMNKAEGVMKDDGMMAQLHDEQSNLYEERFFEHTHLPEDLNMSIQKAEQSVEVAKILGSEGPSLLGGEAPHGPLLSTLAFKYFTRFELFGLPEDLNKAAASIDLATEIVPLESRHRERVMRVRGVVHGRRHTISTG